MKNKDWRPTAFAETAPGTDAEEEGAAGRGDPRRARYDFLRHLMTLDAGALVFTVTLVGKAFVQPVHRAAVAIAVGAFLVSLIGAGLTYLHLLGNPPRAASAPLSSNDQRFYLASIATTLLALVSGMAALAWFFWTNWFR